MRYSTEREHAVRTTEHLKRWDILEPGGGALSRRLDDGNILMACTGLSFRWWDVTVDDFIVLDPDGNLVEQTGALGASGTPVHLALYREFPACHGIVHAHSPHALAFASLGAEIPSVTNQLDTLGTIASASADDLVVKQRTAREGSRHRIPPGIVQSPGPYTVNERGYEDPVDQLTSIGANVSVVPSARLQPTAPPCLRTASPAASGYVPAALPTALDGSADTSVPPPLR